LIILLISQTQQQQSEAELTSMRDFYESQLREHTASHQQQFQQHQQLEQQVEHSKQELHIANEQHQQLHAQLQSAAAAAQVWYHMSFDIKHHNWISVSNPTNCNNHSEVFNT
jgi:hypothetical protein